MSAAKHILRQMRRDPRLAYLIGPGSESFELMCDEVARETGKPVDAVRDEASSNLAFQTWPSEQAIKARIEEAVEAALRPWRGGFS